MLSCYVYSSLKHQSLHFDVFPKLLRGLNNPKLDANWSTIVDCFWALHTPRMVICFVISVSVVTSLVFFSAMLLAIGPSGELLGILGKAWRHPAAFLGVLHSAVKVILA